MPSLTPLTNLNSGFRMYEVDSAVGILVSVRGPATLKYQSRHLTSWMHTRKFPWLHMQRRCAHPVGCRWVSHVNEFPALDNQMEVGPTYVLEYSTRGAYGQNITWGANDPLNATWWYLVTERGFPCSHASHVR